MAPPFLNLHGAWKLPGRGAAGGPPGCWLFSFSELAEPWLFLTVTAELTGPRGCSPVVRGGPRAPVLLLGERSGSSLSPGPARIPGPCLWGPFPAHVLHLVPCLGPRLPVPVLASARSSCEARGRQQGTRTESCVGGFVCPKKGPEWSRGACRLPPPKWVAGDAAPGVWLLAQPLRRVEVPVV